MIGDRPPASSPRRNASRPPGRSASSKSGSRGGLRRRRRLPRPHPRLLAAVGVLIAIAVGGWFWLRDSSLVAVRNVTITGVSGPDARQIRRALTSAARGMTTLDVNMSALRTAVRPYPVVKHLHVGTSFPHRMVIDVSEQVPVAVISSGGSKVAVSGDGLLLHDVTPSIPLPTITVGIPPGGDHVTGLALADVQLLAAAPYPLLGRILSASDSQAHGLTVVLRNGPHVYFGNGSRLGAKWADVDGVLASSTSAGADYIDVSVPARPVAGIGADTASAPAAASSGSGGSGTAASQGTSGGTAASGTTPGTTNPGAASSGSTVPSGG